MSDDQQRLSRVEKVLLVLFAVLVVAGLVSATFVLIELSQPPR
jgi:cell division protein FtsL